MIKKTYNLYCDESTHLEHDRMPYMIIAYISAAYPDVKIHTESIRNIIKKHKIYGEIKWSNVSNSKYEFYVELIEYFFASELNFRAIIVDKSQIDNERFNFTYDDFYHRMYYQLLFHKINMEDTYNVYLDIKDTRSASKIKKLEGILNLQYSNIRNLQFIRSHESVLMQLCDLLMGAVNYYLREENKVIAKNKLIAKIQDKIELPLHFSTPKSHEKFNRFFLDLKQKQ